jgi:uncharacterized protein YeaO (DUF488 family)
MLQIVRLGSRRGKGEGLRIGAARRPPRGVKKKDYARLDYYDVWLPELAPSQKVVSWALSKPWTDERWQRFKKSYLKEMKAPDAQRLIELFARLSHHADFSLGCYCEDESRCHRSILRELLKEKGGKVSS